MYFVSDIDLWNHEFLKKEVLGHVVEENEGKGIYYKNKDHLLNVGFWNHVLTKKPEVFGNCLFHFSVGKKKIFNKDKERNIEILKEVVTILNPRCIVFCGDENLDLNELNVLGNQTTLFLREYYNTEYTITNNTHIVPIGYGNGLGLVESITPCTQRKYHWSFTEEKSLLDVALVEEESFKFGHIGPCEKKEIRKIYNESIFVPIIRKKGLDCSDIYDALSCGSIPVVVGSQEEYKIAFGHILGTSCVPPWVHGETWDDVVDTCTTVLQNEEMLVQLQKNCIIWWQNILSIYRTVINPLWE